MPAKYTPVLPLEKLTVRIDASGDCWEWIGGRTPIGYGRMAAIRDGKWRNLLAHRLVYTALCGPIPGNLPLDHLCRNTGCVNPDHLEPVPDAVNTLRGFNPSAGKAKRNHCPSGHLYTPENTIQASPRGKGRHCRQCKRERDRVRDAARAIRHVPPGWPDLVCRNSHERTTENTSLAYGHRRCLDCLALQTRRRKSTEV